MANRDIPSGFTQPRTDHGGPPKIGEYKNTAVAIFKNDLCAVDGAGRVFSTTTANISTDAMIGVAVNYVSATADQTVQLYDDLVGTSFEIQVDDNTITNDTRIGDFFDLIAPSGDTTTLQSAHELNGDLSDDDNLILVGMITRPDNDDTLTNNKVRVKVRTHTWVGASQTIGAQT